MGKKKREQFGFTWLELLIVLFTMVLFILLPEWYARDRTKKVCEAVHIGSNLKEVKDNSLFSSGMYFYCGFDEKTQSGAVVKLVGGWFPFGRDFCVVTVEQGTVIGKHTVFGNIDHDCDTCKKDIRRIVEIEQRCQK